MDARIELDLRIGAAFTRFQTLGLQKMGGILADTKVISYGLFIPWETPELQANREEAHANFQL